MPVVADSTAVTMSVPTFLPTVQIDGIVWSQVTVGDMVYATGRFTTARPAGVALGGAGTVTRTNLLAYNIRTGVLDNSFNHSLTGDGAEGRAITASPDGSRVYVGGTFSAVDGQARSDIAGFATGSGQLLPGVGVTGPNNEVLALAATNSTLYLGGGFSKAGAQPRQRLAAVDTNGTLLSWAPRANGLVEALLVAPGGTKVVAGGAFSTLNEATYHGLGAVSTDGAGNPLPWASQSDSFPIRDQDPVKSAAAITSLSTNGSMIFLTGFNFGGVDGPTNGGFEGRAAIDPGDGHLIWVNDCHGDSYGSFPVGNVLYSVSHAHECTPAGGFPETTPQSWHRALAETITPSGVNGPGIGTYASYQGLPRSDQLDWYPVLNTGNVSGANQGAWSITGTSAYLSLGGEFTKVNGTPQQGLVRYAVTPLALSGYAIQAAAAAKQASTVAAAAATQGQAAATAAAQAKAKATATAAAKAAAAAKQAAPVAGKQPTTTDSLAKASASSLRNTGTSHWNILVLLLMTVAGFSLYWFNRPKKVIPITVAPYAQAYHTRVTSPSIDDIDSSAL